MEKFSALLADIDRGRFDGALTEDVREITQSLSKLAQQGKAARGTVTLKLTFAYENGMVTIKPSHSVTTPRAQSAVAVRFLKRDGTLSAEDPRQQDIFVEKDDTPVAVVRGGAR